MVRLTDDSDRGSTALIRRWEQSVGERSRVAGTGVGLHRGSNDARRLNSKLVWILDDEVATGLLL